MKKILKQNLKLNLIITLGTSISGFILNGYFSKYMGLETLGLMRLFTQIIAYLNLADMGIGMASAYALYRPLSERNQDQINIIISTINYFYKRVALVILLVGLLLNVMLHNFIKVNSYGHMLYIFWSLYVINTSISYLYAKYPILFTANQEFNKVRMIQGSGRIVFQILQIIFMIKTQSFLIFILIMILENLYLYIFYNYNYKINYKIDKVKIIDKNLIKDTKNLFWHKLAGVIVFNTDYIVLSKFVSLSIIGIYSSYLMIYQMLIILIGIITDALTPIMGKYVAENTKEDIYKKWNEIYIIYFYISTFLIICTYYLITPFIKLWLGEEYVLPKISVILILINLFIQMIRGVTDIFKTVSGFFDDIYAPFLEGILNLIFSLIMVQKMQLNGVIIGTLISNLVIILILKPILVFKRCFEQKGIKYLKTLMKYFSLSILSMISIDYFVSKVFKLSLNNINNWIIWFYKAISVGIISLIIVTIIFILNNDFRKILNKNRFKT